MYVVIGRVRLEPGREEEALAMIGQRGVAEFVRVAVCEIVGQAPASS